MSGNRCTARALTVVGAVLVGLGLIAPGAGLIAAMIALPMFAAMIAFVALTARHASPTPQQTRRATGCAARTAGVTAIVVSALGGLADLVGAATVPILVAVGLVTAPWAWSTVRHHVDRLALRLMIGRATSAESDPNQRHGREA